MPTQEEIDDPLLKEREAAEILRKEKTLVVSNTFVEKSLALHEQLEQEYEEKGSDSSSDEDDEEDDEK